MHELGLCEAIADAIERRAKGRPVTWARVRIGGHAVDPALIRQGVQMAAAGGPAESVDLEVILDPARARCRRCGTEAPVTDALGLTACQACGGIDVEVVGGEEAVLEAVAYATDGRQTGEENVSIKPGRTPV